jgi:hypothetical protein
MGQTALQELISEWEQKKRTSPIMYLPIIDSFIEDAKAKLPIEKEQIIDAQDNVSFDEDGNILTAEQYYNYTYQSEWNEKSN